MLCARASLRLPSSTLRTLVRPTTVAFRGFANWWEGPNLPITLLGGFLGAGKTTLLKRILENRTDVRVGVVVNDVASVNIDAQLVSSQAASREGVEVTELQNGCVCCSLAEDLFDSVVELLVRSAESPGPGLDHIIIELSGVGEPGAVIQNWRGAKTTHHPATHRAHIARVVTVVDASYFQADWLDGRAAAGRNAAEDGAEGPRRSVVDLLAEQIEAADTVLLNKADLASEDQLALAESVVLAMNPAAEVLRAAYGDVDLTRLLSDAKEADAAHVRSAVDASVLAALGGQGHADGGGHGHGHGHEQGHGHGHGHGHGSADPGLVYGIRSFVYRARRPFHSERFEAFAAELRESHGASSSPLEESLAGLLRSKGVCWLDGDAHTVQTWSLAGRSVSLTPGEAWWHASSDQHLRFRLAHAGAPLMYRKAKDELWDRDGDWGDRRQEIVFIGGHGMKEEDLRQSLDGCLLNDAEMDAFAAEHSGPEQFARFETAFGSIGSGV